MICSHGVWWAIIILNQFPKLIVIFVESFYMRMIDRYTYQKRSWCGWLDGYLMRFDNISWIKWYSEENLLNTNNVCQTTIFRRFKSTVRSGMDLLLMTILLRKSTARFCLNINISLVTGFLNYVWFEQSFDKVHEATYILVHVRLFSGLFKKLEMDAASQWCLQPFYRWMRPC